MNSLIPTFTTRPANRRAILVRRPVGIPQATDFTLGDWLERHFVEREIGGLGNADQHA